MNRAVVVLLVLAVALAAYLFLVDLPREREEESALQQELRLFDFQIDEVDTLALVRRDHRIVVAREDGNWWIRRPFEEPAQAGAVRDRLSQLAAAEIVRVVRDSVPDEDWGIYGLESLERGRKDIRVSLADGSVQVLQVGNETPSGALVYVRRQGSPRLAAAERAVMQIAWSRGDGLRDVQLFDVVDSTIVFVEVDGPAGHWSARRRDDGLWVRADVAEEVFLRRMPVLGVAHDLGTATIRSFEGRLEEHEWSAYGFAPPFATFRWRDVQGRAGRVDLGNETGEQRVYARRDLEPDLLVLLPQLAEHVQAPVDSLVDRNPLRVDFSRVESLTMEFENGARQEVQRVGRDWYPVVEDELVTDDDGLEIAAENLARGLEEFQPQEVWLLGSQERPADVLDRVAVRVHIRSPHADRIMGLGWRGRGVHHWCFLEGDPTLYRVGRGLYLRFRGLALRTGALEP